MSVILAVFGGLICNLILIIVCYIIAARRIRVITAGVKETIAAYFTGDADRPSEFNALLDTVSKKFAAAITASIKANLLALKSASTREDNALAGAIATDAAGSNPIIGALMAAYPKTAKIINKNPELVQLVMSRIMAAGQKAGNNGHDVTASGNVLDINNF